jgi:hypothetical protein
MTTCARGVHWGYIGGTWGVHWGYIGGTWGVNVLKTLNNKELRRKNEE